MIFVSMLLHLKLSRIIFAALKLLGMFPLHLSCKASSSGAFGYNISLYSCRLSKASRVGHPKICPFVLLIILTWLFLRKEILREKKLCPPHQNA